MDYKAIDYSKWDMSGQGKNILSLLNKTEKKIWKLALPYQDKRQDAGHGEIVTYFALKLLQYYSKADRKIGVPAAIGHDIGWNNIPEQTRIDSAAERLGDEQEAKIRKQHETEGVKLTKEILNKVNYDTNSIGEILKIIERHDTGIGFKSLDEGLVRDADKLYRFSKQGILVNMNRDGFSLDTIKQRSKSFLKEKGFFYSEKARKIAEVEWKNTLENLK